MIHLFLTGVKRSIKDYRGETKEGGGCEEEELWVSYEKSAKSDVKHHMRIPFFITNLSLTSRVVLPKDYVMAFITPENPETNYIEIAKVQSVEDQRRNWKLEMLPKAPESDFLVSPGDIKKVRRCVLSESDISDITLNSLLWA